MSALRVVAVPFISLLVGCSQGAGSAAQPKPEDKAVKPAVVTEAIPASGVQCPSQDFGTFLKAFANDVEVQKSFTHYPYKAVLDDDAHMDSGPETSELSREQIEFPLLLGDAKLAEQGATMESQQKTPDWYQISTHTEGSGAYSMTFNFHRQNGCWYLTDSVDTSS